MTIKIGILVCVASLFGSVLKGSEVEIIAHRGASFDAPENTLASVNLAWKQQADAVEIDVWLTTDGQIVAMHDSTPKRYGGPDQKVSKMSWNELNQLDVGRWKNPKYAGEKVPLLHEILATIPDGRRLFIEIKCGPEILPVLKSVLEKSQTPAAKTVIISFSADVMTAANEQLPNLERYWIVGLRPNEKTGEMEPTIDWIMSKFRNTGSTGLDLGGKTALITEAFLKPIESENIPWAVWTVNDLAEGRRLINLGAIGITTDKPAEMRILKTEESE